MTDSDHALRLAANDAARLLSHRYDDLVPLRELRAGFTFEGERASFGSFQRGDLSGTEAERTGGAHPYDSTNRTREDPPI